MLMRKVFLNLFMVLGLSQAIFAQEINLEQLDGQNLYYDQEFDVEMRLHSNGFALGFNKGVYKTYYRTSFWHFDFGLLKHIKEYRQSNNPVIRVGESYRSFVYGKQNSFFILRGGKGLRHMFGEKAREKGVNVSFYGEFGPALGFLKPYYLRVSKDNDEVVDIKYEDNPTQFLQRSSIIGSSSFGKGLNELKLRPGLQAQFASQFEWNASSEGVSALDFGLMLDYFFTDVPLMLIEENQSLFINVYLSLRLGKKS
jgi:hypothetical protein